MTIYDIAKEAGVSVASVSRYFNHRDKLSPSIQKKINQVVENRDFIPNQMARGLVFNSMKTIGIIMSDVQHLRFSTIAYNLERSFFEWGYNTLICNTGDDIRKTQQYLYMLYSKRVDAIILIGSMLDLFDIKSEIKKYFSEIPVITSDMDLDMSNSYSVTPNHFPGTRDAVMHLMKKNHKNIAFVANTRSSNTHKQINAYLRSMNELGLPLYKDNNVLELSLAKKIDSELDVASLISASGIPYTGLIFSHDEMAARAIGSLQFHGYRVPEDFGVIGYDNTAFGLCCQPLLTSIDTQGGTIARVIANLVNDIFNQKEVGNSVTIKSKLVIRRST
ncbi:MAG: LacI family DNA-binding transcriptional regulator [Oscillospiraceae bacterium]|nr:LacI family DNA-binding transcriptional regulator [Oscillospiraceae bacterium]